MVNDEQNMEESSHPASEQAERDSQQGHEPEQRAAEAAREPEQRAAEAAREPEQRAAEAAREPEQRAAEAAREPEQRAAEAAHEPRQKPAHGGLAAGHGHDDHGFAHVVSVKLLAGVLGALLLLTVLTVTVTKVDLGGQLNLIIAMVIATIKGGLVVTFFMHLLWDKKFNLLVFMTGVLFVILFIGLALTDRKEYQHFIDQHEQAASAQK
jgi:cytochrome c oxidase subunit 4